MSSTASTTAAARDAAGQAAVGGRREPALVLLPGVRGDRDVVDRPEGGAQVALELVVGAGHRFPSIRAARASRPRDTCDFTVPRLMLIASAISASVRSSQ